MHTMTPLPSAIFPTITTPALSFLLAFLPRRPFSDSTAFPPAAQVAAVDPALVLRLATVLYQQQNTSDAALHAHLSKLPIPSSSPPHLHELFLQVCNRFPSSWRPVHRLQLFLLQHTFFSHSSVSSAKALSVYGRARNVDLLWSAILDFSAARLLTLRSVCCAVASLAEAREIKKCVELFLRLREHQERLCDVHALNAAVGMLCEKRLVDVAGAVVKKLRSFVAPNEVTYGVLVIGFCRAGDLVEASKVWNKMLDQGMEPDVEAYEEIVVTMFKNNRFEDAMRLFKLMRARQFGALRLASYSVVIDWLCKEGRILHAFILLAEMLKRGVGMDNSTLGALMYGLLVRRRLREGYKLMEWVTKPDVSLYHGLIKGLLRLRRTAEATQVFREMIKAGCEPVMHTYIMLLQGHLGKRGRKGRHSLVNFESIFVGGLVKAGKTLQATKYVERMMWGGVKVPRFDYNNFLHCFSNDEGVMMFEEVGNKLKDVGLVDLGYVFLRYGERMATRDRRRRAMNGLITD